ncbi:hypothetical protein GCM10009736_10100 [Actinomadura bangladeshensis]
MVTLARRGPRGGTWPSGSGRIEAEDISRTMLFLVSDAARPGTGETVSVSAGQTR